MIPVACMLYHNAGDTKVMCLILWEQRIEYKPWTLLIKASVKCRKVCVKRIYFFLIQKTKAWYYSILLPKNLLCRTADWIALLLLVSLWVKERFFHVYGVGRDSYFPDQVSLWEIHSRLLKHPITRQTTAEHVQTVKTNTTNADPTKPHNCSKCAAEHVFTFLTWTFIHLADAFIQTIGASQTKSFCSFLMKACFKQG